MVSLGAYDCHVAALITLTANCFYTLAVKQREIIVNNVLLFSVTNEETPYEYLLYYWGSYITDHYSEHVQ